MRAIGGGLVGAEAAVWKTAVAAAVAWQAAVLLVGARPYFAPLAAVLASQPTVAASLSRAVERSIGVAVGIVLALGASRVVGTGAIPVGGVVLVAMGIGRVARMPPVATSQIAISALLVMAIGAHTPGYAVERILDTLIGSATALVVHALLAPADYTGRAEIAVRHMAAAWASLLHAAARRCAGRAPAPTFAQAWRRARRLRPLQRQTEEAIALALDALRYSPLRQSRRPDLDRLQAAFRAVDAVALHVRGVLRVAADAGVDTSALARPLAEAARTAAAAAAQTRHGARADRVHVAVRRLHEAVRRLDGGARTPADAAVAIELDELVRDLERSVAALGAGAP